MIDSLELGKQLMLKGRLHSVHEVCNETGIVWLQPEPKKDGECVGIYGIALVLQEASPVVEADFIPKRTKIEIDARIDELRQAHSEFMKVRGEFRDNSNTASQLQEHLKTRIEQLEKERSKAIDDIFSAIVESHKVLCRIKEMGEKEAYGQDPAFYYGSAVAGEAGEMVNKMVKAFRHGGDATEALRAAVLSELPDVVVYSFVLAYVLDMDLTKMVTEKARIVVERALAGYYGGPLFRPAKPCTQDSPCFKEKCEHCASFPSGSGG